MSTTSIKKFVVCAACHGIGVPEPECICTYQNGYPTIELEFEVCDCCGHPVSDGTAADTPFNDEQFAKLK